MKSRFDVLARRYAVAVLAEKTVEVVKKHLSIVEATAFSRTYNRLDHTQAVVILTHPISRAIRRAKSKSRSA
jgi:hypothetical protein